ncbi:substrate-binding domain-containing protein [Herbidospora mongoliensis]|uniref:substrate-binding domain-containing protein n=1 Tax=Herbidospora mongoliensis TaxID=688067 RepID=UPI000B030991|nr:substrate-binding domain-containing protein [Herbidospora mongoliensis]
MGRHRTDEIEGGYPAYEQPPARRKSSGPGKVLVPLAGAVALAVLLGVAAYVVVNKDTAGCSGEKVSLFVAVAKDIEPAVTEIAGRFVKAEKTVDGRCVEVAVKGTDSDGVAAAMAGTGGASSAPDIWIPDSSLWLSQMPEKSAPKVTGNLAHSPIVLVAPKAAAAKLAESLQPSWTGLMSAANAANPDGLASKVRVVVLDPAKNAAGLGALLAGAGILQQSGDEGSEELLVGVMRQLWDSKVTSPDNLFATLSKAAKRVPIGVTSEQSIWAFNSKNKNAAVALYPAEGTVDLDYPIITTAKDPENVQAAKLFTDELASAASRKTVQQHGFRTLEGQGTVLTAEAGMQTEAPTSLPIPGAAIVTELAQSWKRVGLGTKLLSLLDVSGTMARPADSTGITRMQAISQVSIEGLKLFPDKTEIGTWIFSDNLNGKKVDWKETVPIGPLAQQINGVTRREVIAGQLTQIKAIPTGNTGLNDSLWAAYQKLTKEYEADKINTILLFTDGVGNDDPTGGITNAGILKRLRESYDPAKPVSILVISFNTQGDENRLQMQNIAKATGGDAFFPETVLEIRNIFLQGIARRLCAPNCPSAQ